MKVLTISLFLLISLHSFNVKADSPLTSTVFYTAYMNISEVKYASEKQLLDDKLMMFLTNSATPTVHKLAVINALSWGNSKNVELFQSHLLKVRKGLEIKTFEYLKTCYETELPDETDQVKLLTSDDLMCWAYIQVMGDYFTPRLGGASSLYAYFREKDNMSYATVLSLILAQITMDDMSQWCSVYELPYSILVQKTYTKGNLSDDALNKLFEYLGIYKDFCEK